jgi:8-oxo-dGTP pyrophosphatase MutT (NUDIX family)
MRHTPKILATLLLLCIWISVLRVPDISAGCGAGTVLYFKFKDETYLLLADHGFSHQRDRGWSGFGGRCDGEPPASAAARETEEETKGFYSRKEILVKLNPDSGIRVADFTTYFLEVDFVPANVINTYKASHQSTGYHERGPYAWLPISAIWQSIENKESGRAYLPSNYLPPEANTDWLFEPFVTSLLAARSGGILPWEP